MSDLRWDLDELVRLVMSDLRSTPSSKEVASSPAEIGATLTRDFSSARANLNEKKVPSAEKEERDDIFDVGERVVVAEFVRKALETTDKKIWRFRSGAVVTPSAKDALKKNGIEFVLGDNAGSVAGANSQFRPTVSASNVAFEQVADRVAPASKVPSSSTRAGSSETTRRKTLVISHLPSGVKFPTSVMDYVLRNSDAKTLEFSCLKETTKRIAEELASDPNLRVVLATYDGAIASIWANRLQGVRAVAASSVERARRDFDATNANVVIVDPRDSGIYQFRLIVDAFLKR